MQRHNHRGGIVKKPRSDPGQEKELFWIRTPGNAFRDGYNYFGRHPEEIIAFFDKHVK